MKRNLIHWAGLTGLIALASYTTAVVFAPAAYPGYNWMAQAVSDLSAEAAPSRTLWNQLAALYNVCSVVCVTCASIYTADHQIGSGLFRTGIHLFTLMNWISNVGYSMFPLPEGTGDGMSFQGTMHIAVTILVVVLSVASLVILIVAGRRNRKWRGIGICAGIALAMMLVGSIGTGVVPSVYFGIAERFSVFAAVGFNAVLGYGLFNGFQF
jgi:hypothetical membrane protein